MDSIDKRILEARGPQEVMEPSNVGRILQKMTDDDEAGHVYLTLRGRGIPHIFAVITAHDVLLKFQNGEHASLEHGQKMAAFIEEAKDIEPPIYYGLN